jgi:signal transduction histidine kinase
MIASNTANLADRLHELRQPLNVIRLATGNLRTALGPQLDASAAAYLLAKLERIDQQIDRANALADDLARAAAPRTVGPRQA